MRMPKIRLARIKSQNVRNVTSLIYVHKKCGVRQSIKLAPLMPVRYIAI